MLDRRSIINWQNVAIGLLTLVLSLVSFIGKGYADRITELEKDANIRDSNQAVTNEVLTDIRDRVKRIEALELARDRH